MELVEPVENESTTRPFQCDWHLCGKSFNRKSDLQRHYRIHTNERPYSCNTPGCGKTFIQKTALTVHVRTHTGEKPHQCQHIGCGKRFADSSSLSRHRRIHTGKPPYKCTYDGCLKSFRRKTAMLKHQRRSHQRGIHSSEINDPMVDSDSEESPATLESSRMHWPPHGMTLVGYYDHYDHYDLYHATSPTSFGQHFNGSNLWQHCNSCHGLSSGDAHEHHGILNNPSRIHPHPHHPGVHMFQQMAITSPHRHLATESNPGTANPSANPQQPPPVQYHHQIPRQGRYDSLSSFGALLSG